MIGGIAAVLHGVPRATFDLDLLLEANLVAAKRAAGRPVDLEDARLLTLGEEE